jgi:tetratricopeptide (TPR) repeat protein
MRPPRLLGRTDELQRLLAALAARRAVVLAAPSGGGKSRLLDELGRAPGPLQPDASAPAPWLQRLPTRQDDAAEAFGAARRWLGACLPQATDLDDEARTLCHALAQSDDTQRIRIDSAYDRGRLQHAVARALRSGARAAGAGAIAVDDLQFADADSRGVLTRLHAADDALPLVLALRTGLDLDHLLDAWLDQLAAAKEIERIALAPLSNADCIGLLRSLGLPSLSGDAEQLLVEQSAGRPSRLLEAIKTAWPGDAAQFETRATATAALSLAQTVAQRYAGLASTTQRVLGVLAIAGDDLDPAALADAVQCDRSALDAALAEGEAVGVLAGAGIVHDSLREALVEVLPAAQLDWAHGALAAALMRRSDADPRRIARHLRTAGRDDEALPFLSRAARGALLATDAAQLWQDAATLHEAQGDNTLAFEAWFDAWRLRRLLPDNPEGEDRAAAGLARCATSPAAVYLAHVCAAEQLLSANRFEDALARVQDLPAPWEQPLGAGDTRHLSRAAPLLASIYHRAGRARDALARLESLAARIDGNDAAAVAATEAALGSMVLGAGLPARAVRHFDRAVEAARRQQDRSAEFRTRGTMTSALLRCGRFEDAWQCSAEAGRLAVGLGFEPGSRNEAELGAISLYLGRFSEALDLLQIAKGYFERRGQTSYTMIELIQGGIYLHLGRPELAQQVLASIVEDQLYPALRFAWHMQRAVTAIAAGLDPTPHWQGCERTRALSLGVELLRERIWRSTDAPPVQAIAQTRSVAQEAERLHHWHLVRSALTACAAAYLRLDDPVSAVAAGQEALASCPHCDLWTSWHVETWWVMHRALTALGRTEAAAESLRRAADWVETAAQTQVPPAFRDSFTQRVALNRAVREAARTALARSTD